MRQARAGCIGNHRRATHGGDAGKRRRTTNARACRRHCDGPRNSSYARPRERWPARPAASHGGAVKPTDIRNPDTFHRVVDCQWACPAHTPVPEYIRLIAAGRHADAYMVNWRSNVFPGILGRTCDRPCEPACRRGRVEENNGPESMRENPEPAAIGRLNRVAADHKGDVRARVPRPAAEPNGRRVACVGGGPSSLTVARNLAPLGYHVTVFEAD